MIERFEQLEVWQKAHILVLQVYKTTVGLPADQKYGLISQMQSAAVSIPANIAEGFKRQSGPDKIHFHNVAQGSLEQLRVVSQFEIYSFSPCFEGYASLPHRIVFADFPDCLRQLTGRPAGMLLKSALLRYEVQMGV